MNSGRLLEFLLEGLAAMQAAVPGGYLMPPPEPGGQPMPGGSLAPAVPPAPPPVKTVPSNQERQPSWTATR